MTIYETLGRMMGAGDTLKLRCRACGHAADWPRDKAVRRMGGGPSPLQVRERLRCGRCGERSRIDLWI